MTRKQAAIKILQTRVNNLKNDHSDFEKAHSEEDEIRNDALEKIAVMTDCPFARRLSLIALETGQIDFRRVTA